MTELDALLNYIDNQPLETRMPTLLYAASALTERAAYELAQTQPGNSVATLILAAAQMQRLVSSKSFSPTPN